MSTAAQLVEMVFSGLPGTPRPEIRDDIYQKQFDAVQALGEMVSDSPLHHILTRDFQVACVGGSADLTTATLVGGASLASGGIYNLIFNSIKRSKAMHPDSLEPIQWVRGGTLTADQPRREMLGYVHGTVSSASIYLRKEDSSTPSDGNVIFKCSFAPLLSFFATENPVSTQLEQHLIQIWARLVAGAMAAQQAG